MKGREEPCYLPSKQVAGRTHCQEALKVGHEPTREGRLKPVRCSLTLTSAGFTSHACRAFKSVTSLLEVVPIKSNVGDSARAYYYIKAFLTWSRNSHFPQRRTCPGHGSLQLRHRLCVSELLLPAPPPSWLQPLSTRLVGLGWDAVPTCLLTQAPEQPAHLYQAQSRPGGPFEQA